MTFWLAETLKVKLHVKSFERRIVHEFLADATDLKTESAGEGPARRVVIKYIGTI